MRRLLTVCALTVCALTVLATPAEALTLVDETVVLDAGLWPADEITVQAYDSTIRVVEGGRIGTTVGLGTHGTTYVTLNGRSTVELTSSATSHAHIDARDDSRVVMTRGKLTNLQVDDSIWLDGNAHAEIRGGIVEVDQIIRGAATFLINGGTIAGTTQFVSTDNATVRMTSGALLTPVLQLGGAMVDISGGRIGSSLSGTRTLLTADLTVISGGAWDMTHGISRWTIGFGHVFVRGSGLELIGTDPGVFRLTGLLEDGNAIDMLVDGNVEGLNLENVVPEASTALLFGIGLPILARATRRRRR